MQKFHDELYTLMNKFVHQVYDVTAEFPKSELFGSTAQLRRAGLSVILNYIEGYARKRSAVMKNFFETAYGSLKESRYLIQFAHERKYISVKNFDELSSKADKIGAMLWGTISKIKV